MPERFIELGRSSVEETKERVRNTPVCLIIPPSTFLADERVFPFLGILKVAGELEKNGNPVEVLDLSGFSNYEEVVRSYIRGLGIRNFALTATTPQIPAAAKILKVIRDGEPDARVILGGPHVTLTHTGVVQDLQEGRDGRATVAWKQLESLFDKLVVGDGELAIFQAIDPDFKNQIVDAGNLKSDLFLKRGEMDNYASPARHLIARDTYHYEIDGHPAFSVIAQLGCPFECGFCGGRDSNVFRVTRTRSTESIVAEIEQEVKDSIRRGNPLSGVMFYDDELNVVPTGLENLCRALINLQERLGMEMRFRGFVKAELFTPQQAELMYRAGFRVLLSGVESGSNKLLLAMKKHTSREINNRCLTYAQNAGLKFKALMSLGHPGESKETIEESIEWVLTNRPDDVDWTIITQYPGSPYYDRSIYVPGEDAWLYQIKLPSGEVARLWSRAIDYTQNAEYYKGIPGQYEAYVWTDYLSPEELVRERDRAESTAREALGLAPITEVSSLQFEHSMGQKLPSNILRQSGVIYSG